MKAQPASRVLSSPTSNGKSNQATRTVNNRATSAPAMVEIITESSNRLTPADLSVSQNWPSRRACSPVTSRDRPRSGLHAKPLRPRISPRRTSKRSPRPPPCEEVSPVKQTRNLVTERPGRTARYVPTSPPTSSLVMTARIYWRRAARPVHVRPTGRVRLAFPLRPTPDGVPRVQALAARPIPHLVPEIQLPIHHSLLFIR